MHGLSRLLLGATVVAASFGAGVVSGSGHAVSASASTGAPVCAVQPPGARVPGTVLTGSRFRNVAVDNGTRHTFVLAGGDYLHDRQICTTSVIALEAGTGQLLYRTPIGAGVGPYTSPSLAIDGPAFRLFALDAGYTLPGPGTARPAAHNSVAIVDTRTGRLVKSLQIGGEQGDLGPIAVDDHTYRAFVAVNANLPLPQARVDIIAVTRGVVVGTIPLQAQDIVVDQRTNRVFLLTSSLVTTLDGATGRVLKTAHLPGGYYQYNGAGVDERTGRLFVSQLGLAPPHSGTPNPPNSLSIIDSRTGALLRTLLASPSLVLGNAAVDEPAGIVLTWTNNTDSTAASVLDARDGALLARVTLALPRGGFHGPVVVDPRNGDIYGYTYQGIRAIEPGRWNRSTVISSQQLVGADGLAVSSITGVLFGVQWESPSTDNATGYCTIRAGCRALPGK